MTSFLTRRDRRLVSICCSAELGVNEETTEQLEAPLGSGELSYEDLQEVVMHVAVYLGWIVTPPSRRPPRRRGHRRRSHRPRLTVSVVRLWGPHSQGGARCPESRRRYLRRRFNN